MHIFVWKFNQLEPTLQAIQEYHQDTSYNQNKYTYVTEKCKTL